MDEIKRKFSELTTWLDELSLRERGLIFVAAMGIILFLSVSILISPMQSKQSRLEKDFIEKLKQVQFFDEQIKDLIVLSGQDPDAENLKRKAELHKQLTSLDSSLVEVTAGLVSPRQMAKLIEEVLQRRHRLRVIRIESLPPVPLVEEEQDDQTSSSDMEAHADQIIYKHGMVVELTGNYLDFMAYLKELEAMSWKVFWGQVILKSERYPVSRMVLIVNTLSLHSGWIGV